MLFSLLPFIALVTALPSKRVDNREWINLKVTGGYKGGDLCVGLPAIASESYLGAALCGSSNATVKDLTEVIALYGVKKSTLFELPGYVCPTSAGADLTGASDIPVVGCDYNDPAQYWTIQSDGTVTNDATSTCLTLGRAAPNVPLTLHSCGGEVAHLQSFFYTHLTT